MVYANREAARSAASVGAGKGNQFTYWTTGADGQAHLSTGALYLPRAKAPRGGYPVVAWAHGSRGIADACAPSVRPTQLDIETIRSWLSRGYAVVSTDYAGLGTAGTPQYFDLATTAGNIVDAVTAGHDISDELSRKWVVVGEGQGASAAIQLGHGGATERGALDYRGSAATSIPAEFASLVATLGPAATFAPPAGWIVEALYTLGAINNAHPEIGLDDYLSASGRQWLTKASTQCSADLTRAVSGVSVGSLFAKPLSGNSALNELLSSASSLPTTGFSDPVLMTQTLQDQSVVVPMTLKYLNEANSDAQVDARTYLTLDGTAAAKSAASDTRAFVTRVMR